MHALAAISGRLIGRYSRAAVKPRNFRLIADRPLPKGPSVWIGWHESNLITVALHRLLIGRPVLVVVPPGLVGTAVQAWLGELGVTAVKAHSRRQAGLGLKRMRQALDGGSDVLIATDGPNGPRREPKAGALWLAASANAEVRPVGCAASPAFRVPRWDRHLVPLPGARVAAAVGPGIAPADPRCARAASKVARILNALTERAAAALLDPPAAKAPEPPLGKPLPTRN